MVAKQFITCQLVKRTPWALLVLFWCGWIVSAKYQTQSGFHLLLPFSPRLLLCWEIKKSDHCCLSFPAEKLSFRNLCRETGGRCGGCASQRLWSFSGPKSFKKKKVSFYLDFGGFIGISYKCWAFFLFCFPAVHLVDLNRCSPSASHYLQHPPIICFTSLPTPPSPLLASPLILNLDHPSAAQNCVSTEDTSHWAYIINAALTIPSCIYLCIYTDTLAWKSVITQRQQHSK